MQASKHKLQEEQIDVSSSQQGDSPRSKPPDDYEQKIRQLERQLYVVSRERDELERDVEQLCMSRGSNMFSSSYVLSQRLQFLEAEVKQQRSDLRQITTERDSLLEDILQIRSSKRETDQGWQQEKQRNADLERQLSFFQTQSAQAIADRDSACYESKQTKAELQSATTALKEVKARLSAQEQHTHNVQQQLTAARQQVQGSQDDLALARGQLKQLPLMQQQLQQQTAKAEQLQAELLQSQTRCELLQAELATAKQQVTQSQSDAVAVQHELAALQQDMAATEERLQCSVTGNTALQRQVLTLQQELAHAATTFKEQSRELKESNATLHKQLNEANLKVTDLQRLLEQTSAALVSSQAAVKELHAAAKGHSRTSDSAAPQELVKLKALLAEADESLQQAARDKLDIMEELSQAQAGEDELMNTIHLLETRNHQLKVLLAQATQEKVQALLQVAANAEAYTKGDTSAPNQSSNSTRAADALEHAPETSNAAAQQDCDATAAHASATAAAMALKAGAPKRTPAAGSTCTTPPPSPACSAFVFPGANAAAAAANAAGRSRSKHGNRRTSGSNPCGTPPPSPAAWNHSAAEGTPAAAAAAACSRGRSGASTVLGPPTPGRLAAAVAAVAVDELQEQFQDEAAATSGEPVYTALDCTATAQEASRNSDKSASSVASTASASSSSSSHPSGTDSSAAVQQASQSNVTNTSSIATTATASNNSSSQLITGTDSTTWQAEREQLLQQLWLRMHQLEQLVIFASHCRLVLQDLQPGALAAAAADARGSRGVRDPMIRLKALADELEASRKLLLGSRSAQQQHYAAMAALQSACTRSPSSTIEDLMASDPAAYATQQQQQQKQKQGALVGWKLWYGSSKSSRKPLAVTALPGSGVQQMLPGSSSSSSSTNKGGPSKQVITASWQPRASAASSTGSGSSRMVDASDVLWASQLDVAMACEVQLLSDMCVSTLRHIHKLTALSTLMQDFW